MMRLLRFAFSVLAVFMATACISDADEPAFSLAEGDRLPAFAVTMDDGSEVSDRSLTGNEAIIVFFNTSCPDCRRHLPELDRWWRASDKETVLLCISRAESAQPVKRFWTENNLSMPWSAQDDDRVYSLFASRGIPRAYCVSAEGLITRAFSDSDFYELSKNLSNVK